MSLFEKAKDFLSGSSGLLQTIGGGLAVQDAYNRLGSIGESAQQGAQLIAQQGLDQTKFQPFTVTSTTGGRFRYDPVTGQAAMGLSPQEQQLQQQLSGGAGMFFGNAMQPTGAREQDIFNRIRATQTPEEQRQQLALEERLAAQGRLGVGTNMFGGTPEQLALSKAQEEARNQAMLIAMQQAQQEQLQQAQLGQSYLSGSYMPQAQLMNVLQASQLFPQLQQRGQLSGAGLFGEASMGGLEALLGAGQGQANLMGQLGTGLLSGALTQDSQGLSGFSQGLDSLFNLGSDIYNTIFGDNSSNPTPYSSLDEFF